MSSRKTKEEEDTAARVAAEEEAAQDLESEKAETKANAQKAGEAAPADGETAPGGIQGEFPGVPVKRNGALFRPDTGGAGRC